MAESPPADGLDVAALTRGMVSGNENAYRTFYDAYFDRLSRYLLVVAAGKEEAMRDAVQATFVRVVRHIKVFPDDAQFWAWLTVVARSAFSDQTRTHRRYLAFLDRFTTHAHTQRELAADPSAEEDLDQRLQQAVAQLPSDERLLVERKYFEQRSVREIAAELGTSEKAIESRLVRVRRKIKDTVQAGLGASRP